MSLSSLDHETLLQDKIRLDNEIRCMVDSLERIQQENDKLSNKNMASAEQITVREAAVKDELEGNEIEIETLLQERGIIQDKFAHDQLALESEVQRHGHAIERYHELLQENEQLRNMTQEVLEEISDVVMTNETELHSINKQQLQFRLKLEDDLRKKLVEVERKQQDDSFLALPSGVKEMLFDNAKLKDEISLQAVGIHSIDMRAARENIEMRQIQKGVKHLQAQSHELRHQITDVATIRFTNQQRIAELKAKHDDLHDKAQMLELYTTTDDVKLALQERIQDYLTILEERNQEICMWNRRISALNDTMKRLRITRAYSPASRGHLTAFPQLPIEESSIVESLATDKPQPSTFSYVSSTSMSPERNSSNSKGIHSDFARDHELSPILRSIRRLSLTTTGLDTQPNSQLISTVQQVLELWEATQVAERVYEKVPASNAGKIGEILQWHKHLKSSRNSMGRALKSRMRISKFNVHGVTSKPTSWKTRLQRSLRSTDSMSLGSSLQSDRTQHPLLMGAKTVNSVSRAKTVMPEKTMPAMKRWNSLSKLKHQKKLIKGEAHVRPVAHLIATIQRV